jgi:hypothetical protein
LDSNGGGVVTSVSVKLNIKGLNALMTSAPVQAAVDDAGRELAFRAGEDFEYERGGSHPWVARGYVQASNARGMRAEAVDKVLTRAVGEVSS